MNFSSKIPILRSFVRAYALTKEEFYKLKYCSTVVYMVPRE